MPDLTTAIKKEEKTYLPFELTLRLVQRADEVSELRGKYGRKGKRGGSSKSPTSSATSPAKKKIGKVRLEVVDGDTFKEDAVKWNSEYSNKTVKVVRKGIGPNGNVDFEVFGQKEDVREFLSKHYDKDFAKTDLDEFWKESAAHGEKASGIVRPKKKRKYDD